ncbi:MAG TPA: radical SAM family heme chaperone HemW [Pseudomonadaceae bacterium]|nr:radical SAM family heme chaperone HemW [Pseudomonadaceae bacterium]
MAVEVVEVIEVAAEAIESATAQSGGLPPLSLYIHVPWCVRKCPYCDFNSHEQRGPLPEQAYVARLLEDLHAELPLAQGRSLQSIFIGGGTPSLLSPDAYAGLLEAIAAAIPFVTDIEITLEANPGTAEQARFSGYRQAGINRLSIGVQSFNNAHLQKLGRIHDSGEALRAAAFARAAGFDNFNLDLMFALSDQSEDEALADLEQAIACQPSHLSWYQLTIEPNTGYYSQPPPLPSDDTAASMQEVGIALLATHGYERYEVSAYAKAGRASRHNLNYWEFGDYIGIGAGAHGKLTHAPGRIERRHKTRMPAHYLDRERTPLAGSRFLSEAELPLEFLMNALRLDSGFAPALFEERSGLSFSAIEPGLQKLQQRGLLMPGTTWVQPSARGKQYLNELLLEFM